MRSKTILFKGSEKNIERYKSLLTEQETNLKLNKKTLDYENKPDGYRMIQGMFSAKTETGKAGDRLVSGCDPSEKLYITGIANANVVDRYQEIVVPNGIQVGPYVKNPILLADHCYTCAYAVGLVEELRIEADGVHFDAYVGDPSLGPLTDKQKEVRSLIAQRILKTVSIGFIPKEIEAPEWDETTGKIVKAARILKWEMLELSLVPVPANQDSLFDSKSISEDNTLTDIKNIIENELKATTSTRVQSLIFDKKLFTVETAKKWALDHEFKADKVEETEDSIRIGQVEPSEFLEDSFRTIELTDGVKAVSGRLKDGKDMDEKTAQELVSAVKGMSTILGAINANSEKSLSLSEKMLGMLDNKSAGKESETTTEEVVAEELKVPKEDVEDDEECKKDKEELKNLREELVTVKDDFNKLCAFVKTLAERVSV